MQVQGNRVLTISAPDRPNLPQNLPSFPWKRESIVVGKGKFAYGRQCGFPPPPLRGRRSFAGATFLRGGDVPSRGRRSFAGATFLRGGDVPSRGRRSFAGATFLRGGDVPSRGRRSFAGATFLRGGDVPSRGRRSFEGATFLRRRSFADVPSRG